MSDVVRIVDRDGVVEASTGRMPVPPAGLLPVPAPGELSGGAVSIREAVEDDIPFIDGLQKANSVGVGFMPHAQLEGHIEQNHVIVAEDALGRSVGYCIGVDKYFKREDVGVIYHMNIVPERRRGLVAAALLRAMFERSAYGVKLYCCWCAQDLAANRFWEAMGFVPLAFRTGSRKKSWKGEDGARHKGPRIHIFWQKRIRAGDTETPWWFPSQTGSGAMREDRIVLPIPPGTHWGDAKPAVLPGVDSIFGEIADQREQAERGVKRLAVEGVGQEAKQAAQEQKKKRREAKQAAQAAAQAREQSVAAGGLHFGAGGSVGPGGSGTPGEDEAKREKQEARKRAQAEVSKKNDPRLVAMARELRDRWLEHVAAQPGLIGGAPGIGPGIGGGRYDIGRRIEGCGVHADRPRVVEVVETVEVKRLDAA